VKRIASISIGIFCLAILGVMFSSSANSQNRIYVGWFNDANRTVAGHGCWRGPGMYYTCDVIGPPVSGWWGDSEAWLWIYAETPGIQSFRIAPGFSGVTSPDCDFALVSLNTDIIIFDPINGPWFHIIGETAERWEATFYECETGWFWVARVHLERRGAWSFEFVSRHYATLCDESHTQRDMIVFSNYTLNPVPPDQCESGSIIATESTTWGSIKALYK
jgi:hypothetical protein